MLVLSIHSTHGLSRTLLMGLCISFIAGIIDGAPYRQLQALSSRSTTTYSQEAGHNTQLNHHALRKDDDYENDRYDGEVDIYKRMQPSTPPNSLASDPFARYIYEKTLDASNVQATSIRRTIVVGDIHGSLVGFEGFLNKVGFDSLQDSLILAGDLVSKGPQSLEVIDKARALNAKCVRGNHDDKVIRWKGYLDSLDVAQGQASDDKNAQPTTIPADLIENSEHHHIARSLSKEQYEYLLSCPLILTLPKELSVRRIPVYVVHGGIDPRYGIEQQNPWVLLNVRNILQDGTPSRKKSKGDGWADMFNNLHSERIGNGDPGFLLLYGHDASRSLNIKTWSIGLDSGCVYGRALSGYVLETDQVLTASCPDLNISSSKD
ncbi:Metallo-dependent phosphatase-like protein [Gamsiella multidivaricata]|uniref:Metallo-dependent phosphatase-like protein n=1 Tax=Gamsiella multidivaricata TaxID=101098 RepID=UPI0022208CD6|nr:Metallo-dependent phosphatase-like protein [Gamsiella multidivaricata]KAG0363185.1 hypothetical protein BGZ54_008290 [Gamsiella multidivaricata]KAI7819671.1 Metallo-dependent phosphatase-like protein [Gamsiella multidivaricata]